MFPFCTCNCKLQVALKDAAINPSDACTLVGIQGRRASAARPSAPVYATFSFCAPPPPRAFLQSLPCRRRSWRTDAIRDGVFGWAFASSAPRAGSVSLTSHALLLRLYSASAQPAGWLTCPASILDGRRRRDGVDDVRSFFLHAFVIAADGTLRNPPRSAPLHVIHLAA